MKIEDVYPVSPLQAGLYYHWMISPSIYLAQLSYRLKGHFDIDILEKSYGQLVARHAILRTCFTQKFGEELLQVVVTDVPSTFKYVDVSSDKGFSVEDFKVADRGEGFNLNKGSQMRLTVLGMGDNTYEFVWSHHHILMDGWCVSILIKEFFQIYHSMVQGIQPSLNKVYPYSGYVKWLMQLDKEKSFSYWREYLLDYDTISTLPKVTSAGKGVFREEQAIVVLEDHVRQSVRVLCRELGITENTFIQAAWGLLLCKYNNTNDVVYGTVVSGRPAEVTGIGEMIGLFTNNVPVRVQVQENESVRDLLKRLQLSSIEGLDHHYTQLAQIQAETELGASLFDHILVVENFPVQEMVTESVKKGEETGEFTLLSTSSIDQSNYDFAVVVVPEETFTIFFRYNADCYDTQTMHILQGHLVRIIENITGFPALKFNELDYLSVGEKDQLLSAFNQSEMAFPDHTLVSLFDKQAQEHPDNIAVVSGTVQLSYRDLDKRATQLAAYLLMNYAVKADDLIGIMLDRSELLIIAILGVLKAGAAYVPVDIAYPKARKEFLLNDSGAKVLITQATSIFDLPDYGGQIFAIDVQLNDEMEVVTTAQAITVRAQDLAYVIYTSGSTGQPKGVMVEHRAISNTVQFQQSCFNLTQKEKGLQFASPSFDASVWEIFSVLSAGATLYIADEAVKTDVALFEQYINENSISFATLPPAFVQLLQAEKFTMLKKLVTAGEAAIFEDATAFAKQCDYYNAYGPTESSVCATIYRLYPAAFTEPRSIPIGKPIANTALYILDKDHNLLPAGVTGDIFISGAGLARGYFKQAALTAEKFIPHPFKPGERIYKTGDLGKWLPDGNIEFAGRKDDQVKVRGYRIELAEIEQALLSNPLIDTAFVTARQGRNARKEILAYIVSKETLQTMDLQAFLKNTLPVYMIPAHYIFLTAMPLTTSGKVDRKQLAKLEAAPDRVYTAPGNEIEEKLVNMWQEILGIERVGIKDNFFELGGHSLNLTQLIARINNAFAVSINIKNVFDEPTIERIAEHIVFLIEQDKQKQNKDQLIEIAL